MNQIHKVVAGFIISIGVFFGTTAHAASLTTVQVQAVVNLLQSFGVDANTITTVTAALGGNYTPPTYPGYPGCWAFAHDLQEGKSDRDTNGEVSKLQQYLGINPTGYFGAQTRQAVLVFQGKFKIYQTGGVGPLTRAALIKNCGGNNPKNEYFSFNKPFTVSAGDSVLESSARQLSVKLVSVADNTAQVVLGEACAQGTQCFYYPTQTVFMTQGQSVVFQKYTITLNSLYASSAVFTVAGQGTGVTPTLNSISPTQGVVGTQVIISGSGFTADNTVRFGSGGAMHVPSYNDGTTLYYTIPSSVGPCNYVGDTSAIRCLAADMQVVPGSYSLYVTNANGQTQTQTFTVVSGQTTNTFQVTAPTAGGAFTRGQDMQITWTTNAVTSAYADVTLNLYTEGGVNMGTIAIPTYASGSYIWHIPPFPQNYVCTMQYPNGLCGVNIPTGRYYIKATISSNELHPNAAQGYYVPATSGVFTITEQ